MAYEKYINRLKKKAGTSYTETEDKARRTAARARYDAYDGKIGPHLDRTIKERFDQTEHRARVAAFKTTSFILLKKIADSTALNYASPPSRSWLAGGDRWSAIYDQLAINEMMQTIERQVIGVGCAAINVAVEEGAVKLANVRADRIVAVVEGGEVAAVLVQVKYDDKPYWHYYDAEEQLLLTENFQRVTPDWWTYPEQHGFGRLPFVFFQAAEGGDPLSVLSTSGLFEATIGVALLRTLRDYYVHIGGFRQMVVSGNVREDKDRFIRDMGYVLTLNDGDTVTTIDSLFEPERWGELINNEIAVVAGNYGWSLESFNRTSQVTSGYALQLQRQGVVDYSMSLQPTLRKGERTLSDLIQIAVSGSVVGELEIEFDIKQPDLTATERLDYAIKAFGAGLMSIESAIRYARPGASEAEVAELVLAYQNSQNMGFTTPTEEVLFP